METPKGVITMDIYVVKAGDTLSAISQRFGVSMNRLLQSNLQIDNPDMIFAGDEINIPASEDEIKTPITDTSPSSYRQGEPGADNEYIIPQLIREFPDTFFLKGRSGSNRIALTFDDGPDEKYTPQILAVLKEHNVPATFFLLGINVQKYPGMVQRISEGNHVIGNHSWSHPDFSTLSKQGIIDEVMKTEKLLHEIVGLRTSLIRPPYGAVTKSVIEQLRELDYKIINWSVDSLDWRDNDPKLILDNTLPDVTEEAILLFHSAGGSSIAAMVEVLPELIARLHNKGYVFVTVDKLLGVSAYK